ncbi:hypothetical protein OQJ26_07395 [Legionella sp. PATHC038]|uniref:hypothetical protein n=1 Tax=Legionella sheltonii TaxID=2992041 RepID=UPI0022438A61|nr:hypothetical protein [Legionella sp. PATHC038]MCW8398612.1 hypothetical protein [Legionella sp. PATHC038]
MTIRYLSFDFDGCLFNKAYVELPHNNFTKHQTDAVLVNNKEFLEKLRKQNASFSAVYGLIGSTRQDYFTDLMNSGIPERFKGSCCPAIATVCDYLGMALEPLLLADIEGELESGTSYKRIMDEIKNGTWMDSDKNIHQHASCARMDEHKRTILFAQMQKAAADHPEEEIIFDFFDDRLDILWILKEYFNKYPHMIPKNVRLRIHSYAGEEDKLFESIQGIGNPIANYQFCLRKMHENVKYLHEVAEALRDIALTTRPEEKIFSIVKELAEKGLYFESFEQAKGSFAQNPNAPFAVHPSRHKADGLYLVTVSYPTSKDIISIRYGLDFEGKLFLVDDEDKRFEIEMDPQGLAATLTTHVGRAKNFVATTEKLNKPVTQPAESKPEEVSKGEALYQELTMSPYFVADATKVKAVLEANPEFPFVIRKSSASKEGMITFVAAHDTSKGIVSTRYGLNNQGELFTLDNDGAYKLTDISEDLVSVLTEQTLVVTERVNRAKSLEDITFSAAQKTNQTIGVLVAEQGFFAAKVAETTDTYGPGHDLQP